MRCPRLPTLIIWSCHQSNDIIIKYIQPCPLPLTPKLKCVAVVSDSSTATCFWLRSVVSCWFLFSGLDEDLSKSESIRQRNASELLQKKTLMERMPLLSHRWESKLTLLVTQVKKSQTGQDMTCTVLLRLWNLVFADGQPHLLHSSFAVKEILSQYEKEDQMLCNNIKITQSSEQFYSSLHLWWWEGKQSLFIHSWVNYLSLS